MTRITLLPFYSADATTKLALALSIYKGKNSFLFNQTACFRYSFNLTAHANEFYQCKFFCEIHVL